MLNYMNKDLTINFKESMGSIMHFIIFLITSQNQFISWCIKSFFFYWEVSNEKYKIVIWDTISINNELKWFGILTWKSREMSTVDLAVEGAHNVDLYFFNWSIVISITLLLIHVCVCVMSYNMFYGNFWIILKSVIMTDLLNKFIVHRNDRNLLSKLKLTVTMKTLYIILK